MPKKLGKNEFMKSGEQAGVKPKVKDWAKVSTRTPIDWECLKDKNHKVKKKTLSVIRLGLKTNKDYMACNKCREEIRISGFNDLIKSKGMILVNLIDGKNPFSTFGCLANLGHADFELSNSHAFYDEAARCPICKNLEDWIIICKDKNFSVIPETIPKLKSDYAWFTCNIDDNHGKFQRTYNSIRDNLSRYCPICSFILQADNRRRPPSDYLALTKGRFFSFVQSTYTGRTDERVGWICKIDNSHGVFYTAYNTIVNSNMLTCPKCNTTKGETKLIQLLEGAAQRGKYIRVDTQVKFDGLTGVNGGLLSFDGLIAGKSKKLLIEINGDQHYKYIPYFHKAGKIDFYKQLIHDYRKMKYAYDNGYIYVSIKTKDIDNMAAIVNHYIAKGKPTKPTKPKIPLLALMKLKVKL